MRGQRSKTARLQSCVGACSRAVEYLRSCQLPSGEFRTFVSPDPGLRLEAVPDSSPFVTAVVLHTLRLLPGGGPTETIERALNFLVGEQDERGLWRSWCRRSPKRGLVPPDLDDSSCASWILSRYGRRFADNRPLVAGNRDRHGRFLTWVGPGEAENDVDGVVNANVVLYLGPGPDTAAACEYLAGLLESPESELGSWYYPDPLALDYAVSRACWYGVGSLRGCRERLLTRVTDRCGSERRQDPLSAALAAVTLLNCGAEVDVLHRLIELVIAAQLEDGSWPRISYYSGPRAPASRGIWFGSEELTTALCLEALARYSALD